MTKLKKEMLPNDVLDESFWQQQLEENFSTLLLPTDFPRQTHNTTLSQLTVALEKLPFAQGVPSSDEENSLPFEIGLSALFVLLMRYTGQVDISIGAAAIFEENEGAAALNPVIISTTVDPEASFSEMISSVETAVSMAASHRTYPVASLFNENAEQAIPMMVLWQGNSPLADRSAILEDLASMPELFPKSDLYLLINPQGTEIQITCLFDENLFTANTVERFIHHWGTLLHSISDTPDLPIHQLSIMTVDESQQILVEWNDTDTKQTHDICVHHLVEQQAAQIPQETAVLFEGVQLTYQELNQRANQLAHHLIELGIEPDTRVALSMDRGLDMVISVLAVLKAGGAYVPLDPAYPQERLAYMLEDSQAHVLLTQSHLAESFPPHQAHTILLDKTWPTLTNANSENPQSSVTVDNLLYVIYTSGSTGKPKGVALPHRALANLIPWQQKHSRLGVGDRTLQFASLSFDVSCQELFATWSTGGTLVLVSEATRRDATHLLQYISTHNVARLFLPFVAMQHLAEAATTLDIYPASLQEIVTAGEQLQVNRFIQNFFNHLPNAVLTNQYGPSESHVVTAYDLVGAPENWPPLPPIGRPIDNTQIYILDQWQQPVPIGVPGELYIGGVNVARGYLNRPELTAEKFITDPFNQDGQAKLYKTGDLSRFLADGTIEFLGRIDHQVKIRGFRVELGEIDTCLSAHPAIKQAVVMAREDTPGDKRLVAYLVLNEAQHLSTSELHRFLLAQLPDYMVPANFVTLDAFPQTPSGKINRRALPAPNMERPELAQSYVAPQTDSEKFLTAVWADVLKLDRVGIEDNFFELGGNSLLNFHVVTRIKEARGIDLPIVKLFQYSTIRSLAAFLDQEQSDHSFLYDVIARAEKRGKQQETAGIAIIGMALRFPGANSADELWQVLSEGRATTTFFEEDEIDPHEPDEIRRDPHYVKAHGIVADADKFDAQFFGVNPRIAQVTDPQHRVFLELAWAALEDAGYDPDQFDGDIGLYAGMGENTYRRLQVEKRPDLIRAVGEFQVMLGNEKDYVATHTSYKLNLTGPSVSMATACSTSLVAIGEAFSSLMNHDCDMAISGGVSIKTPQNIGYLHQDGGMLSNDGICRPFDVNAQGTMFNNGAGIIVMRRVEDALEAGDQILAVIKSVGVNNDGADKMSFTAPSVVGQAKAITLAQAEADVDPATISYIEAHGTATPLGDPIEVEALTKAFRTRTNKIGYCGIGSVKSNLGHMIAAAGVAGVIKTALALQHKQIPATLHFTEPNPEMNIEESPFFVVDRLLEWPNGATPRRAGVSSFGVGGTNAHAILEEAPEREPSGGERPFQVVMLSAKTEEALEKMSSNLADHLVSHDALSLADIAYTLQVGRKSFNHRRFAVGRTADDIISALREGTAVTKLAEQRNPEIVFMFPGQGSQYVNMGLNLYEDEPFFKETVDHCAEILTPYLGRDLREVLYPAPGDEEAAALILKDTFYTQPALFTIEYALAKLWLSWGVIPSAMIGHSIGEYVAACIAGVFSLEDALKIVALRGRLVSELPGGSMLSVRRPASEIEPRLHRPLALAASNSPRLCVVAGPDDDITAFEAELQAEKIACKHLHTSHAFHSAMMEPIIEPFATAVAEVSLSEPSIPIISTVTGALMLADEATNPQYWAAHVRATVRFAEAVATAWQVPERVLLEIGPRMTSTTLARQQISDRAVQTAVSSLTDTHEEGAEWQALMEAVGRLWQTGVVFEWPTFYEFQRRHRVSLPTYPFARTRYWADPPEQTAVSGTKSLATSSVNPVTIAHVADTIEQDLSVQQVKSMSRKERLIPKLAELLEEISGLDVDSQEENVSFLEFGFDSLFLTQASLSLKNEFNIDISFRQMLGDYDTLNTLAAYIDSQLPADAFPDEAAPPVDLAAPPTVSQPAVPTAQPNLPVMPQGGVGQSAVEQLVAQQLQLMAQQLALLQGGSVPTAPAQPVVKNPVIKETAVTPPPDNGKLPKETTAPQTKGKKMQPFGAIARINTEATDDLSADQRRYLEAFIQRYNNATAKSKSYTAEHRPHHADPRVVTGFKPALKELIYPIVVEHSEGVHFRDIDGNQYIDVLNGFGSNFMGYGHPIIKEAISKQLESGYEIGPQQILTGEVSKLVSEFTGLDRAGFCNTGSEAVMGCMRIARTVTGRRLIAIFSGSYHGIFDEVLVRGTKKLKSLPAAPGVMPSTVENVLVLDYGTEESLRILEERAHELAAIMVEPIQSRRPDFYPREFIHECRRICDENGCAFIFDEVITGFRMGRGGAQAFYGVQADIASYGKVPGGNMPFGMIAGKREWMDALDGGAWQYGDDSVPEVGVTYFAGTFVRHPFALAGAHAVLNYLKENPDTQNRLNKMTKRLKDELNAYFEMTQVPIKLKGFSSLFKVFWTEDVPYGELLFYLLRLNGVHIYDGFPNFLTVSFTDEHVDAVIAAFKHSVAELQANGFLPEPLAAETAAANQPPVPGARLGRDEKGQVEWVESNFEESAILLVQPITESQAEIWLSAQMSDEANCAFNESMSLRLSGELDVAAMETAVTRLIQRHEALRLTISPDGKTIIITNDISLDIPFIDLSDKVPAERDAALHVLTESEVLTPFDLTFGPLLRVKIIKLAPDQHEILLTFHHIIADGWSIAMLLSDLGQLYQAVLQSITTNLPPVFKYSWYARDLEIKQATEPENKAETYWLQQFQDDVPLMDLPTDRPRPKTRTYTGNREDVLLDPQLVQDLKKLGARAGCTFFNTLFAVFNLYLSKLLDQNDLVVGVPAAGQSLVGEEHLIGHCINMLPIRTQVDSSLSLLDYFQHVKSVVLNAYEHQDYTFGSLLDKLPLTRDASRIPLIPITFNIDQEPRDPDYGSDLQASYFSNPRRAENFELAVNCCESPNGLMVEMSYNTDLFDQATILQRVTEFKQLISEIVAHPDGDLGDFAIVPDEMRHTLLHTWNDTQLEYPRQAVVHQLLSTQAQKHPERIAVVAGTTELTYGELEKRANQLARHLQTLGVQPNSIVAVSLDRTVNMLVGVLAVWKAGGAYVPLDPAYPLERLTLMLEDSGAAILLTENHLRSQLPVSVEGTILIDDDWPQIESYSDDPVSSDVQAEDLAYVIYTSGSTGRPKGVQVPHRAAVNYLHSLVQAPGFRADDVMLALTTLSFDIHVMELYLPMLQGGRIILASTTDMVDGEKLLHLIRKHGITLVQATPITWRMLIAAGWDKDVPIRVISTGEALPVDLARELQARSDEVWDMYGPTETTVHSTLYRLPEPDCPVLIGKPMANTQVYVLDKNQKLVPIGVPGELYIGGDGVTHGYLGRPELTAERFVSDPFADSPDRKMYRTGDLVRFLPDGNLEYFRRLDNQVKIRGFRIETGEIEAVLVQHPTVAQAVVVVHEDDLGEKGLAAYLIPNAQTYVGTDAPALIASLREFLTGKLPHYMIPAFFIVMADFPMTPNGKVNKRALPAPETSEIRNDSYVAPRTDLEEEMAAIWADSLRIAKVGVFDDFFALGGHSLMAIQVIGRIRETLTVDVALSDLFQMPTIAELAQFVAAKQYVLESETLINKVDTDDQESFVF